MTHAKICLLSSIIPSAVFLPTGLDLIRASNRQEAARMMRMIETKNVISDEREVQFYNSKSQLKSLDFPILELDG